MRSPLRCLAATSLSLVLAGASLASGPAMRAPVDSGDLALRTSFQRFASEWMERAKARSGRNQQRPRAQSQSAGALRFVYRGVAEAFDVDLEPTGNPSSPYVGVIRYTEQTFSCRDARGADCTLASSEPVSEVFRFRAGRWSY